MDAAERDLIAATVADALGATPDGPTAATDATLRTLGWLDLLAAEPDVAVDVVFRSLGRTNRCGTALDDVLTAALTVEPRPGLAVVLPPFGGWQPPGRIDDGILRAHGLASARIASADELLIVVRDHTDLGLAVVPAADATAATVRGIDPDARMHVVDVVTDAATVVPVEHARWEALVALARRAVAHQLAGASRAMLDLARSHAVERAQFGRPIASFQAIRHRLADSLVAIEACDAALDVAGGEPGEPGAPDEPDPRLATLAKVIAGRSARTVATHGQQVLAGVGFTTDHPFHRYLKRTMLLDGLFGSADDLTVELGRRLLATRRVPTLIEL